MTQLLNLMEAAKMLRIHRITLRRHIAEGSIPVVQVGRRVLVREEDIEKFIADRTVVRKQEQVPDFVAPEPVQPLRAKNQSQ